MKIDTKTRNALVRLLEHCSAIARDYEDKEIAKDVVVVESFLRAATAK
jgi:hypothetical protein